MPLIDAVKTVITIQCDYCLVRDTEYAAPTHEDAVEHLVEIGWRQVRAKKGRNYIVCPACRAGKFAYAKSLNIMKPEE